MSEAQTAFEMARDAASQSAELVAFMQTETFENCPPLVQSVILDRQAWMQSIVNDFCQS